MNDRTAFNKNNTDSIDMPTDTDNNFFPDLYCAQLNYTVSNDYITIASTIPSDCATDPSLVPVGRNFELRYNPLNPRDFIKQSEYYDDVTTLIVRIVLSVIMTMSLISFYLKYRSQPGDIERDPRFARSLEPSEPQESPEARKERILSKMIFQIVKDDLSNTTAAAVRSSAKGENSDNREARATSQELREGEGKSATAGEDCSGEESGDEGRCALKHGESGIAHSITIENAEGSSSSPFVEEDLSKIDAAAAAAAEKSVADDLATGDEITVEPMNEPLDLEAQTKAAAATEDRREDKGGDEVPVICCPACSETAAETRTSAGGRMLQSMLASWRGIEESDSEAECCICLDGYASGDTIGASKNVECNHVFHKDCIMDWMMKNHNQCPLCRVDLLK
ncbi:MAG: hypothetical protein SGBAC_006683 [Bacillariaceae sp.]